MATSVLISSFFQRPGAGQEYTGDYRIVTRDGRCDYFPGGGVIDGTKSRDPGNTLITCLRPGLLMGKVTASGKWAPSVIGVLQSAYTSGGTSITLTAAQATEVVRRVGSTGTLNLYGSPTASGTVATQTITYSAVNTTTGVLTITDLGANNVAGSLVGATDGSQVPRSFIPDGPGINIDDVTPADVGFKLIPMRAVIDSTQLLPWPSDTNSSLQTTVRTYLNTYGQYIFSTNY